MITLIVTIAYNDTVYVFRVENVCIVLVINAFVGLISFGLWIENENSLLISKKWLKLFYHGFEVPCIFLAQKKWFNRNVSEIDEAHISWQSLIRIWLTRIRE